MFVNIIMKQTKYNKIKIAFNLSVVNYKKLYGINCKMCRNIKNDKFERN